MINGARSAIPPFVRKMFLKPYYIAYRKKREKKISPRYSLDLIVKGNL